MIGILSKLSWKFKFFMNIVGKLIFLFVAVSGIVLVFYVSWFWRALIIPMVVIILIDVTSSFLRKKK